MRKIIAAIVAGFILGAAGTVTAAPIVQAVFAKFNFVIDGKKVDPGVDPLVYQGTTYLPVRVFSNMLGYDVVYRADSRTIEIWDAKNEKESREVEKMPNTGVTENMIGLRELAKSGVNVEIGPIDGRSNTLRLQKGELVISVYDFVLPENGPEAEYQLSTGGTIKVEFRSGSAYLPTEKLRDLGLID